MYKGLNEKEVLNKLLLLIGDNVKVGEEFAISNILGADEFEATVGKEFRALVNKPYIGIDPVYINGKLKRDVNGSAVYVRKY